MTLSKIIKIINIITGKKTPCDIEELLEEERYSQSKDSYISIGAMDLFHFLRVYNKNTTGHENTLDKIKKLVENL